MRWANLTQFMSVLVVMPRVIYRSTHVTFCGSCKHIILKWYLGRSLTGRTCRGNVGINYIFNVNNPLVGFLTKIIKNATMFIFNGQFRKDWMIRSSRTWNVVKQIWVFVGIRLRFRVRLSKAFDQQRLYYFLIERFCFETLLLTFLASHYKLCV